MGLSFGIAGGLAFGHDGLVVGAELGSIFSGIAGFREFSGLFNASDYLGMIKVGDDFSSLMEDGGKLLDEFRQRFSDYVGLENHNEDEPPPDIHEEVPDTPDDGGGDIDDGGGFDGGGDDGGGDAGAEGQVATI